MPLRQPLLHTFDNSRHYLRTTAFQRRFVVVVTTCFLSACRKDAPSPRGADTFTKLEAPVAVIDTAACLFDFQVDQMPDADPKSHPHATYPEDLRQAGIEGYVRVRFVVDTFGKAEPSSVRVLSSSHRYFTDAVRRVLPRIHYLPATKGGKPVRCWTEQRFDFNLTDSE